MRKPYKIKNLKLLFVSLFALIIAIAIIATILYVSLNYSSVSVFSVCIDGNPICYLSTRQEANEAVSICEKKIESSGIGQPKKMIVELCHDPDSSVLTSYEASEVLFNSLFPGFIRCYSATIDGENLLVCNSYEDAEEVIEELKEEARRELKELSPDNDNIAFNNVFQIESAMENRSNIMSIDEIRESVIGNVTSLSSDVHVVSGTQISSLFNNSSFTGKNSTDYGISRSYDDSRNITYDVSYGTTNIRVDFAKVSTVVYSEIVEYDTEFIETKKLYVGETKVSSAGSYGTVRKTILLKHNSDGSTTREIIDAETIVPAKTEIILKGVKKYPSTEPTGFFMWPLDWYVITSTFGEYRPGFDKTKAGHYGIDLAVRTGYPVRAADGGVVIHAQMVKSYGNLVKIQHEDGVVTYYAHLSEILVKEGDKVYKGQEIAKVGMTGDATGPHLHFEVRIDGQIVDPMKYLP